MVNRVVSAEGASKGLRVVVEGKSLILVNRVVSAEGASKGLGLPQDYVPAKLCFLIQLLHKIMYQAEP